MHALEFSGQLQSCIRSCMSTSNALRRPPPHYILRPAAAMKPTTCHCHVSQANILHVVAVSF
eukprot:5575893-Amphidinium_carterae.1